jgi:tRNA G18 (ribose-2'-O)-methylase SpoU
MEKLKAEIDEVIKRDYQLEFTVPTEEQLAQMKKIYREITTEDRSNIEKLKEVVTLWEKGDLPIEVLPKKLRERLKKQLEQLKEQ